MNKIFISYRRADSESTVGRMYDRLIGRYGKDNVFKDVDEIPYGEKFARYISNALAQCDVLLAVIGPSWADAQNYDGSRRLDDPDDFVRREIEAALAKDIVVIPITVQGAGLPRRDQLPESLRGLLDYNLLQVRGDPDFGTDMQRLTDALDRRDSAPQISDTPPQIVNPTPAPLPPIASASTPDAALASPLASETTSAQPLNTLDMLAQPITPTPPAAEPVPVVVPAAQQYMAAQPVTLAPQPYVPVAPYISSPNQPMYAPANPPVQSYTSSPNQPAYSQTVSRQAPPAAPAVATRPFLSKRNIRNFSLWAWVTVIAFSVFLGIGVGIGGGSQLGGNLVAIGAFFEVIYFALVITAYIMGIIKTAQLQRWGWMIAIILTSLFGTTAYGFWGPETPPAARPPSPTGPR